MPTYLSPGVYVEEVSSGARPIESVPTSIAAFVGQTPELNARVNEAFAVNNWSAFKREYVKEGQRSTHLSQAVFGFFENGGHRCYVVNTGAGGAIVGDASGRKGLDVLETVDEVAIVAVPGKWDTESHDALLSHCEKMGDRFGICDCPETVPAIEALTKVGSVPVPGQPPDQNGEGDGRRPRMSNYGAYYFPCITVRDALSGTLINTYPSGYMAGVYARSDATRGVHKAPANETVRGALNVTYRVTRDEQGVLNSNGVNCIRFFNRQGVLVWGARTVAGDPEWRYVNVRRLFNQVEESIGNSTRWVVFEPNDPTLWKSIRRDITAFLTLFWRDGALMGKTPAEAFFVKCDEETNTPEVIDAGMVVTLIGLAPVKPAEFVVFRIGQRAGGTEVQSGGGA